eukprot:3284405-Alexandrium_andersonii.AAC.1
MPEISPAVLPPRTMRDLLAALGAELRPLADQPTARIAHVAAVEVLLDERLWRGHLREGLGSGP